MSILWACLRPGPVFPRPYAIMPLSFFFVFNGLRWEVVVCFVDIGGIVVLHCLNFLFIECSWLPIHGKVYLILNVLLQVLQFPLATDYHNLTEIWLKVLFNTHNPPAQKWLIKSTVLFSSPCPKEHVSYCLH